MMIPLLSDICYTVWTVFSQECNKYHYFLCYTVLEIWGEYFLLHLLPGYHCSYLGKLFIDFRWLYILLNLLLSPLTRSFLHMLHIIIQKSGLCSSLVTVILTLAPMLLLSYEHLGSMKDIDFSPTFSLIVVLVELSLVPHHEVWRCLLICQYL